MINVKKKHVPKDAPSPQDDFTRCTTKNQALVLLVLQEGRKTRAELCQRTGLDDRQVREAVSDLRSNGVRVISSSTVGGYWIAESEDDYMPFRAELYSRAMKILETIRAMDRRDPEQITFEI